MSVSEYFNQNRMIGIKGENGDLNILKNIKLLKRENGASVLLSTEDVDKEDSKIGYLIYSPNESENVLGIHKKTWNPDFITNIKFNDLEHISKIYLLNFINKVFNEKEVINILYEAVNIPKDIYEISYNEICIDIKYHSIFRIEDMKKIIYFNDKIKILLNTSDPIILPNTEKIMDQLRKVYLYKGKL